MHCADAPVLHLGDPGAPQHADRPVCARCPLAQAGCIPPYGVTYEIGHP
jgi:hypothetical protein